jgi:superfamily II DNA helicase RecQ
MSSSNNLSTPLRPTTPPSTAHPSPATLTAASTPRRRKTPQPAPAPETQAPWPRIKKRIPVQQLVDLTEKVFGYKPRDWQLKVVLKILEGNDGMVIAGTGAGKSLIFGMLALAAELAGTGGTVIVVSPLKALQLDQVSTDISCEYE